MAREVASAAGARDPVIDVARGIAILLVVLGHNSAISRGSPHFVAGIFLFHVPLFFLLSGYVFRRSRIEVVAGKLIRRLLVPCFAVALLIGTIKSFTRDEPLAQMLVGVAWATGQTLPWSHLWFLPTLFLALMLVQLMGGVFERHPWQWLIGMSFAAFLLFPVQSGHAIAHYWFTYPVGLPWGLDLVPLCMVFVLLGYLLQIRPMLAQRVRQPAVGIAAVAVFAVCAVVARSDLNLRIFEPFLPALIAAVGGCVLALNAAALMARSATLASIFALLGRHTMPIFLLHVSIQKALLQLDVEWLTYQVWLSGALAAAVAVIASIMIERYLVARVGLLRYLFLSERAA